MNKTARLEIRLPQGLKEEFLLFCKNNNETPSDTLRAHISNIVLGSGNMNESYKNK